MGFNSVYRCLQEIFPQVDARLLRAVAIEHPKDADEAAAIILAEVIPFMTKYSTPAQEEGHVIPANTGVESVEDGNGLRHRQLVKDRDVGPSSGPHSTSVEICKTADCALGFDLNVAIDESRLLSASDSNDGADKFMNEIKEQNNFQNVEDNINGEASNKMSQETSNGFNLENSGNFDQGQLLVDVHCENIFSAISREMEPVHNYLCKEVASTNNNGNRIGNSLNEEWVDFVLPSADAYSTSCDTSRRLEKCETSLIELENSEAQPASHVQKNIPNAKGSLQLELDAGTAAAIGEPSNVEDEIDRNNAVSQYSQGCRIDILEEVIDEAKTNKKTLFSSMESLINLMKEVELQEKAAEQANVEAATGGSSILARAEEYKTMLAQAKEANDMHAGEVYGEKAILATELKELQSRLLGLSDERDKSLAIIDEMHQILEARLAAAEESRKAAEREKMEREECARNLLVEQETLVEKVVLESARLQQEAEENSKLREFLMDRGRVVDMLQGEISVICQDIRLLKEKFDANLPLSKSFTSSQTSCILASSGSSHKTLASDEGYEHNDSSEVWKTSPVASVESLSTKKGNDKEGSRDDHRALLDDGWDIFEKDAELGS